MSDEKEIKKIRPVANAPRRGGLFLASVAVGATAVGVYYFFFSGTSKDGTRPSLRQFICEKLQCSSSQDLCSQWDWSWDRQSMARPGGDSEGYYNNDGKKSPVVTRNLIFVRHGQYKDTFKNDSERILTDIGRQQATYTGRRFREAGIKFDVFVHSTMRRAVETADLIAKELSLDEKTAITWSETDLLREGQPLRPTPYFGKSITGKDQDRIDSAFSNFIYRPPPTQAKDTYELYVCHANVIRYLALRALQLAPEAWLRFSIAHASITWIAVRSDGTVSLRKLGEAGHLPPELETR